jgi:hypothetical protein
MFFSRFTAQPNTTTVSSLHAPVSDAVRVADGRCHAIFDGPRTRSRFRPIYLPPASFTGRGADFSRHTAKKLKS